MDTLATARLDYQSGFGNEFATKALPEGRDSPQRPAYGLYAELLGTAFIQPRSENHCGWAYRPRPSTTHGGTAPAGDERSRGSPHPYAQCFSGTGV